MYNILFWVSFGIITFTCFLTIIFHMIYEHEDEPQRRMIVFFIIVEIICIILLLILTVVDLLAPPVVGTILPR